MGLLSASITLHRKSIMDNPVVFNEKVFKIVNDSFEVAEISDLPGVVSSLNNAGIIVAEDTIYLKAKQTLVRNNDNQDIAVFNDDGSFNANLINAKQIVADGLKANTFDAGNATINNLIVTNAQVAGKITATSGSIGGFEIGTDQIGLTSSSSSFYQRESEMALTRNALYLWSKRQADGNVYNYKSNIALVPSYNGGHIQVVDDDIISASDSARVLVSLRSTSPSKSGDTSFANTAIKIDVTGASEDGGTVNSGNHALWIENGDIAGLRLKSKVVGGNYTLNDYDNVIILNTGKTTRTIYLPSSPKEGQIYFIVQNGSASYDLYSSGGYLLYGSGNDGGSTKINPNSRNSWTIVYFTKGAWYYRFIK